MTAGLTAALGVLVLAPLPGTAATVPTPKPSTPSVTVPSASVPSVTVPSVSTPVATTPAVTTPAVSTPAVSTPAVTPPAVGTPSAGSSSGSSSSGSSVGSTVGQLSATAGNLAGRATGAVSGATAAAGRVASGAAGTGASPGASTGSSTTGASTGSASGSSGSGTTPASTQAGRVPAGSARARRARSTAAENRRLRRLVSRLHGCLANLNPGARRLLSLRAGLAGKPRSAAAVARLLHVSARREGLLEQLALLELQRSAAGGCAGTTAGRTQPAAAGSGLTLTGTPSFVPAGTLTAASAGGSPNAAATHPPAIRTAAAHSGRSHRGGSVVSITPAANRVVRAAAPGSGLPGAAIPAFAALVLGLCLVALPGVRRRLLPAPAGGQHNPRVQPQALVPPTGMLPPAAMTSRASAPPASPDAPSRPASSADRWVLPGAGAPAAAKPNGTAEPSPASEPSATAKPNRPAEPSAAPSPSRFSAPTSGPMPAGAPRPSAGSAGGSGPGWAREHAGQAAVVATVLAGGLMRALTHPHSRRHKPRRG